MIIIFIVHSDESGQPCVSLYYYYYYYCYCY